MKKTPIFAINLRKNCILLYSAIFLISVSVCSLVSKSEIKVNLNTVFIKNILLSNNAFTKKPDLVKSVFPFFSFNEKESSSSSKKPQKTPQAQSPPLVSKALGENISVKVSNSTSQAINTASFMQKAPDFLKTDFEVLILHTHTSESYVPSEKYNYTPSDTFRTLDNNYNMVAVGKVIKSELEKNGIKVYHDTTTNDYPSYNQSYNKSCAVAEKYIKDHPNIKVVLDIHRDAIADANGNSVKYVSNINGKSAACLMMVVGSDLNGLKHDNWDSNLSFAFLLQEHINSMYPSLMRPVNFRKQRFNQHLAPGAIIVEVGSNANTLDEALCGAQYFAEALSSFIKKNLLE